MITNLAFSGSIKYATIAVLLTTTAVGYDFSTRLQPKNSEYTTNKGQNETYQEIELITLTKDEAERIKSDYQQFDPEVWREKERTDQLNEPTVVKEESNIDELSQKGKLERLFAEGNQLSLKAIVENTTKFAVVEQVSTENKQKTNIELKLNDELYGYRLTEFTPRSIVLTYQDRVVELLMYQRATINDKK